MREKKSYERVLRGIRNFLTFFLLAAFITTSCTMLFVTVLASTLGVELTDSDVGLAAKLTFGNVILLSLIFTVVDTVRRKLTVDIPVKRIAEAAEKVMRGDLSVRIKKPGFTSWNKIDEIIDSFNSLVEELSSVETLRTDFVANVSHEMKTPLAVMQNYAGLLSSADLPEDKRIEYATAMSEACRRLSAMMTNMLKLNRLENQQIYPKAEEYDLSEQICECLLGFETVWERRGIEIDTDIEEDVRVRADAELLSLVWNNLLSNAFKFTDDGGRVRVTLKSDGDFAVVSVEDNGCGMSREIGEHIFEKFYQGDGSRATQGNGLGLALVKRVIDITDGEISVNSVLGEGSEFTVRIRRGIDERLEKDR